MNYDPFKKVLDSSIWQNADTVGVINKKDPYIRLGVVVKVADSKSNEDIRYIVEVRDRNDKVPVWCRLMTRMGGAFNYEEYSLTGFTQNNSTAGGDSFAGKAGDLVVVALLNGEGREGVILGGLKHTARSTKLKHADGPTFSSEFNGVETHINKDGEYILTYKGTPTNISALKAPAGKKLPAPAYNAEITGSFFKIDKTGSLELSDNASSKPQSFKIDKKTGKIEIKSDQVSMTLDKKAESIATKSKLVTIDATDKIDQKTKAFSVAAASTAKIKSPKVAIGSDSVELLEQIIKAIDAIGKIKAISPVGPCSALMATAEWPDVDAIKSKIDSIKGSL
jgi:hypothetical protein